MLLLNKERRRESTYRSAVSELSDGDSANADSNARARCIERVSSVKRIHVVSSECAVDTLTDDVDTVS